MLKTRDFLRLSLKFKTLLPQNTEGIKGGSNSLLYNFSQEKFLSQGWYFISSIPLTPNLFAGFLYIN